MPVVLSSQIMHDVGNVLASHLKQTEGTDGARCDACLSSCNCAFVLSQQELTDIPELRAVFEVSQSLH